MKRLLFALSILTMFVLSACGSNIQSVDLSQIFFDGVSIGDSFEQIETDNYTPTTRYPEDDNTYSYEEWRIFVTDDTITEIIASFGQINILINGKEDCTSVNDIVSVLGENYNSSWYDKEQSLMQMQYSDKSNKIQCIFVYDKNSNNLIWGIIKAA